MQQWNKSILFGCLLIAVALIIAGNTIGQKIANNLGRASSYVPDSITVSGADRSDYMSILEAASYCRIDYDSFERLLNEGKLAGTYAEIPVRKLVADEEAYNGIIQQHTEDAPTPAPSTKEIAGVERVFIKVKLDEWMMAQAGM